MISEGRVWKLRRGGLNLYLEMSKKYILLPILFLNTIRPEKKVLEISQVVLIQFCLNRDPSGKVFPKMKINFNIGINAGISFKNLIFKKALEQKKMQLV